MSAPNRRATSRCCTRDGAAKFAPVTSTVSVIFLLVLLQRIELDCALVTLMLLVKCQCVCGCRDAVFSGHLNALGATSLSVYAGLECALVTLMLLVHCRGEFT